MAVQSNPSFGGVFRSVWNGFVETCVRLPVLLLAGFLVYLAVGRMQVAVAADNAVLREAIDLLQSIVFLPVEIAIYRLLILGEASTSAWASSAPRMQRMVGWTVVLWAIMTVPKYLANLTSSTGANIVMTVVVVLVAITLFVRLAVLFAAIAVDAPGATLGNAWADTNGHVWLIVKTYLIVLLPLLAVVMVTGMISDNISVPAWLGTAGDNTLEYVLNVAFAAAAARVFEWIVQRMKGLDG